MGRVRAVIAVALTVALGGCGSDDGSAGGGGDPLSYLPADAGSVVVVDTDLGGAPAKALEDAMRAHPLEGKGFEEQLRGLASDLGLPWEDLEPLLGNDLIVGTPGLGLLSRASRSGEDLAIVGAIEVEDEGKLRELLEGPLNFKKIGEESGADLYAEEENEASVAIENGTLVFADRRETLAQALRTHDGPATQRFSRRDLGRATTGLPGDAPITLYANLARVTGQPDLRGMRKVKWVDALRTGAVTIGGRDGAVVADAQATTDPAGLTDADLPFAPGTPATAVPTRPDTVDSGSANQSQTTTFLLDLLRAWRPTGRFAQDVATVERQRGIDFDEEVLRQFDGPSSSALSADGSFGARSAVRDPKRMERTLRKIAPDVPRLAQDLDPLRKEGLALLLLFAPDAPVGTSVLGESDVTVERVDGERALYRISDLAAQVEGPEETTAEVPDEIVFGLLGDAFVVASDVPRARAAARQRTAPVPGVRGAGVMRARGQGPLRPLVQRVLGFDPGPRADLTGSIDATRARVRATARVRMP